MKKIRIGICVPVEYLLERLPYIKEMGFESISIIFNKLITQIDLAELASRVKEIIGDSKFKISSIGYYANPIQNEQDREMLKKVILSARYFETDIIGTFAGAITGRPVVDSIPAFTRVFSELAKIAENENKKIAIENCMQGGNWNSATGNIAFNPKAWEMMFDLVPNDNLGLEWEPAHQMAQLIDPIEQLKIWGNKVFHVHAKDAVINWKEIYKYGVSGTGYIAQFRNPGIGETDWKQIFQILISKNYEGDFSIEGYQDPIYKGELEMLGQVYALNYLKCCRGEEYVTNPWD